MSKQQFDATKELREIRRINKDKRHKKHAKSCLDSSREELVQLRADGGSYKELADWLKKEKRLKVDRSTVMRFLKKPLITERNPTDETQQSDISQTQIPSGTGG